MNKDKAYLVDIAESMRLAVRYLGDTSFEAFIVDDQVLDAVHRRLEIIGEATKRMTPSIRDQQPQVPWQKMAGMRDRLIHGYDRIELDLVYDTVKNIMPPLIPLVQAMIDALPDPE